MAINLFEIDCAVQIWSKENNIKISEEDYNVLAGNAPTISVLQLRVLSILMKLMLRNFSKNYICTSISRQY
jgi:hypothetical protein